MAQVALSDAEEVQVPSPASKAHGHRAPALSSLPLMCTALPFAGPLLEKCLPDVTLGELPVWLVTRDFSPKGLLNTTQTGEAGAVASPWCLKPA